jgi:pimeloyl-ACP methyl ester carboxylesterase
MTMLMHMRHLVLVLIIPVCLAMSSVPVDSDGVRDTPNIRDISDTPNIPVVRGEPEHRTHECGSYVRYAPEGDVRGVLVLVHGQIGEHESAIESAQTYLGRWTKFADQQRFVLLAPAFEQENFGGHAGPGGGYRGLFGRHCGADYFVNAIVDELREALPELPEKFALYGHSAGGQFASRYIVMHPERISAAVISAPASYAFPDPEVAWTNGMKPLHRRMRWSDDEPWEQVEIVPDRAGWEKAAQIPVVVIVGSRDTGEIKPVPGNPGRSRVVRARAWVRAMRDLARRHEVTPGVRFAVVAGVAHNSAKLTPACQDAMLACLAGFEGEGHDDVDDNGSDDSDITK